MNTTTVPANTYLVGKITDKSLDSINADSRLYLCGWKTTPGGWEFGNYQSIPGKYLGIWTDRCDWTALHNIYGLTNLFISYSQAQNAVTAGFNQDSLMINLGYDTPIQTILNSPTYKYYFVDEPAQHIGLEVVFAYAANINPNSKLFISDYRWPDNNICNAWLGGSESIWNILNFRPNIQIMCDQYMGNVCGSAQRLLG